MSIDTMAIAEVGAVSDLSQLHTLSHYLYLPSEQPGHPQSFGGGGNFEADSSRENDRGLWVSCLLACSLARLLDCGCPVCCPIRVPAGSRGSRLALARQGL